MTVEPHGPRDMRSMSGTKSPKSLCDFWGHSPWSPEIAKRFRGLNPGHLPGVSGHPHVRPEWGDIPPTPQLLHHRAAHGQRPWRNGGVE